MSDDNKRRNLGRGLSALFGDEVAASETALTTEDRAVREVATEKLSPGKFQPRMIFDEDAIADLVESIRDKGILQPILVRPKGAGYEIIAGERRWRAAQRAQLHSVPVIVKDFSDRDAAEVALVENLQRQDLSAIEEAEGYRRLQVEFEHTQEDLAKAVGKSRSHVANTMRLLALPEPVRAMVEEGALSAGHARALLTAPDPVGLAKQVVGKGLNVRQTEKLVQKFGKPSAKAKQTAEKDADTAALERDLSNALGVKVSIRSAGRGGELVLHYGSLEQFDAILRRLNGGQETAAAEEDEYVDLTPEELAAELAAIKDE